MKKGQIYKIVIGVMSVIIILQGVFIIISRPKKPSKIPVGAKASIAIVIDDWGYNLNNLHTLDQIKYPLTMSILPNLSYSSLVARDLHTRGFEILLHLPMEPMEKYRLERNTIMASMDEGTIINIIDRGLASVVYAKGVSNHMGSRATGDSRVIETIFKELKKRRLYFLDSVVSRESVVSVLARKMNLGLVKRDVFLDNQENPAYIKGQIDKLKMKAKRHGRAIGICHDRKVTLETLKEIMPQLEREGYKFVFVSELVR